MSDSTITLSTSPTDPDAGPPEEDPARPPLLGGLKAEYFTALLGGTLADLTSSVFFPDLPNLVEATTEFESRKDWTDNYGARLSGWLIPPTTGDYRFFLASDDQGALFLSTDETPGNKVQIASEPAWNGYREYTTGANQPSRGDPPVNISASIPLVAGRPYYVEALLKEGSFGDHLSVAWQRPGDAAPANGASPIPGAYLASSLHGGELPPNSPPVAVDDIYPLGEDMILGLGNPALGLLKNDIDADGDTLTAILVGNPSRGTVTLQPDGRFTYTPTANFNGPDTFTYKVNDGTADSGIATVTINVNPANDPPTVAVPIADFAVNEDAADTAIELGPVFADIETADAELVYSVQANSNPGLVSATVDNATDTLTLHYAANQFGTATIAVRATDVEGLYVEDSFAVTVNRLHDGDPGDVKLSFNPTTFAPVHCAVVQPDGKILVGGAASFQINSALRTCARLNPSGTWDTGFNPNPNNIVYAMVVLADGKILIGGTFTAVGGVTRNHLARLNPDGSLDTAFDPNVNQEVRSIVLQPDGKILIGGLFTAVRGVTRNYIARCHADGSLDTGFNPGANANVYGIAVQPDGQILLGGDFTSVDGAARSYLARLDANGGVSSFNPGANAFVTSITVQPDGKLLIGGNFTTLAGATRNRVARLNPDGTLDTGFDPNANYMVRNTALQADGKIVISGAFNGIAGATRSYLARLNPDGSLDAGFNPGANNWVFASTLLADGKVLVGGWFNGIGGIARNYLALLENEAATQTLAIPSQNRIEWLRGGSSPETPEVAFDLSTDAGATWASLGAGTRITGGWEKTGLNLPAHGLVRARARVLAGDFGGSAGLVEATADFRFNSPPIVANSVASQTAIYGTAFSFTVPANTFDDADAGQTLSYTVNGLPGWLTFNASTATFSGTPPALGSSTITLTATDNGSPALSASTTFDLVVGKAELTATGDTLYRFYGEANPPLTGSLTGVVNGDNITASYSTTAMPGSPAGVYTIYVTLNDPENRLGNYNVTTVTGALRVERAPQTITFGGIPAHVYGDAPFTVPVSASSGLPVMLTSSAASVGTVSGNTLTITGAGTTLLTAYQFGDGNYQPAAFVQTSYTVGKATPVIVWAAPAPITSSTPLSPAELNATANTAGSFSYSPAAGAVLPRGQHNISATFTPGNTANYTMVSATVELTVLNSAPIATAQSLTTSEDTAATITLTGSDVDGDTLSFLVTSNPSRGTLSGTAPNLTYTPWPHYHGPDQFTFQAGDGTASASATVTLTVTPVNDVPVATSTGVTATEDTAAPVRLSASDVEAGGYAVLQVFGGVTGAGRSASGGLIEGADERLYGTTEFGGAGDNGTVFRVNRDGSGYTVLHSFAANRSQGVWPRARLVAGPGGVLYGTTTIGGNSNSGTVWKLNTDGTGFAVVLHKNGFPGSSTGLLLGSDGALYGTTVFGGAASAGTVYKVGTDGSGYALLHSFSGLANEGGRPYAQLVEDEAGVLYGTTEVGGADAVNGGTVFKLQKNGTGFAVLRAFTGGTGNAGTLRRGLLLASDGALYGITPTGGQNAKGTVFKVQRNGTGFQLLHQFAADGKQGGSPQAALVEDADGVLYGGTIFNGALGGGTVFRLNQDGTGFGVVHHFGAGATDGNQLQGELVVAGNDRLYGTTFAGAGPGSGVLFTLERAASGLDYTVATGPAHGTLSGTAPDLSYTPAANYHGADTFTFSVSDGEATSGTATVAITVTPVNDRPYAKPLNLQLAEDSSVAVVLGANDVLGNPLGATDADGDPLTFIVSSPAHGTFSGTPPNLTYTPEPDFHGSEYLSYTVSDGIVTSSPAGITLVVTPVNDAPVDRDRTLGVLEDNGGGQVQPQVDVDGDAVTYFVVTPPQHGRVELQGGNLTYLPDANYNGPDSYTFRATDGTLESPLYNYTLNVIPVNDAPTVAQALGSQAGTVGTAFSLALPAGLFADVDAGTVLTETVTGLPTGLVFNAVTRAIAGVPAAVGSFTVTVTATDNGQPPLSASTTFALAVAKGTPVITWATPADISCRTPLGPTQLNATVNTAGTLTYDPPVGTSLPLGDGQVLAVSVTPADPVNWNPATATRTIGVRLHPGAPLGQLDSSFNAGAEGYQLRMIVPQPNGKVVVCGWLTSFDGVSRNEVARLNADGSLDLDFDPGSGLTGGNVDAVALQADGKVLIGGDFSAINGMSRRGIARLNEDGTVDASFNPGTGANSGVLSMAVQPDGKVVIGGWFTSVNGVSRNRIARLNSDGSVDTGFNPGTGVGDNYVWRVAVQPDGKVLLVGAFTTVGGASRNRIARLNADGSLDTGFDVGTGANQNAYAVAVQPDGKVLVGGVFTSINGVNRSRLARLNDDGSVDTGFSPSVAGPVWAIAIQADGRLFIGGNMGSVNGVNRMRVARLLADGTVDAAFDPLAGPDNQVRSLALQPDGKLLIGGDFDSVNGIERKLLARLEVGPEAPTVTLNGPASVTLEFGTPFADPGATALDACGSELSVSLSGTVNTIAVGDYTLTYVATDAAGQRATATRTVSVVITDHPPVAVAGADQQVVAGTDCVATVAVDGGGSSDADGDALSFTWQLLLDGAVIDTVSGQAAVSWSLSHGTYEAVLTVSTDQNGTAVSQSDSLMIEVLPSVPALAALSPAGAYAGGPTFNLTITGGCFLPGAVVHWNGSARPTTVVSSSELTAAIPAADLQTGVDIAVASVQVVNGDGQVSNPLGFSIVAQTVGTADAAVTEPGGTSTVSTAPATSGEPGVTVTVQNGGDQPVTVLAASYVERPVGDTAFQVDNGSFVDVQITGADEHTSATVFFYYPSTITGGMENRVKLRYFDGANWIAVLSSGGLPPAKDTTDNLDGTVSGGRFAVVFDATSTPTIMDLTGTVFGMIESEPQLGMITGPTGPVALGNAVSVTANFAVVGDPADAAVRFLWDDGTESIVAPETATSATATHLYAAPGVYGVTVQVTDGQGDVREGRFEYAVIYDPSGGFVTGGGWLESAPGAYLYDPTLTGKATFGFNSKYLKGQSVPAGNTQFQFQAGDFQFHSTAYEWLVVAGAKAQYKGVGRVNGTGDYGFLLTATDGQLNGGSGFDKFRIKIWDRASGTVVYDNRRGAGDDVDAADPQAIGGGSILIQRSR